MGSQWDLRDRRVLITGAARGIGAETARQLARRGARLALVGLEPDELEEVGRECGPGASWHAANVLDTEDLDHAVAASVEHLGGLDVVMANAGVSSYGSVASIDPEAFEGTIAVNLLGTWRTVRTCLPHVTASRGYVLCVASLAAAAHGPGMAAYAASKAGVEAFANALRMELVASGVDVGVAYYSWIGTDMVYDSDREVPAYAFMRSQLKGPLGRTYPVERAAEATVAGIERRDDVVAYPSWVRAVLALRGVLRPFIERDARPAAPEIVRRFDAEVERRGAGEASMSDTPGARAAREAAAVTGTPER
jgi:NAD(P)-dependent dehydrogenase (short-subunit alcohol dehydrogenase family)